MTAAELRGFEAEVAQAFAAKRIRGPIHLSGGNEETLIDIFGQVHRDDWVFATYRNHYHALLHGVPRERVMEEILAGRSMGLSFPEQRFMSSAIVGGCLPIAVGVAAALKRERSESRVWCFVGDMAATLGAFHEALQYAHGHDLPIRFVVEDNGVSCNSPTDDCWGGHIHHPACCLGEQVTNYRYEREWPHAGVKEWVRF